MAKLEKIIKGDFDFILRKIEQGILNGSVTASLEDSSDFATDKARCSIRVFERYSALGSNRLSLNVALFKAGEDIRLSAITSGGSQGMFLKFNTFGEGTFLKKLERIVNQF